MQQVSHLGSKDISFNYLKSLDDFFPLIKILQISSVIQNIFNKISYLNTFSQPPYGNKARISLTQGGTANEIRMMTKLILSSSTVLIFSIKFSLFSAPIHKKCNLIQSYINYNQLQSFFSLNHWICFFFLINFSAGDASKTKKLVHVIPFLN